MKMRLLLISTVIVILFCSITAYADVNYVKKNGITYFIPWFTLETNNSASDWMESEESRAQLTMALSHDYELVQQDAKEIEFETNALQPSYLGRNENELELTIVSEDLKNILIIIFDVPEQVARAIVITGREATPLETIESSNRKNNPDGFYRIDNTILENVYEQFNKNKD